MSKIKEMYRNGVARATLAGNDMKNKAFDSATALAAKAKHNLTSEDAALSDAVVTIIILLGGVIVAIIVYNVARKLVTNTSNGVENATSTLVSNLMSAVGNEIPA